VVTLDLGWSQFHPGNHLHVPGDRPGTRDPPGSGQKPCGLRGPLPGRARAHPWSLDGSLDNSGERIEFTDAVGENVLDFEYRDGWYPATDGYGYSLVVRNVAGTPYHAYDQPVTWAISLHVGGSPGAADTAFAQAYYGWDNFHFTSTERINRISQAHTPMPISTAT
jgi:hypothetical protein